MIQHVCRYALYCMHCIVSISVPRTWSSLKWMDGRGTYYGTVRYGAVLPLGGEGMLVCMYACTCAGLGGAGLGGAVLCGACAVRCWLHCRSLMKKMKVKDKKRK